MAKIFVIAFSQLHKDPRVLRQIRHLSKVHEVVCAGYSSPQVAGVRFLYIAPPIASLLRKITVAALLLAGYYEQANRLMHIGLQALENSLLKEKFDVIIANDIDTLPFAYHCKGRAKILFDAHEFSPREFEDSWKWRIFFAKYKEYLCEKYISKSDQMITVCEGIADEYQRYTKKRPIVITNAANYANLLPQKVEKNNIKMIHHGAAVPSRCIERMVAMMDYVDERFSLDLMLVPSSQKYYDRIRELVQSKKNVNLIPPVSTDQIVSYINNYDIGLYLLEPTNFNNYHALPNKLFEFVQARLAIAIGPSPEMARIVEEHQLGIIASEFSLRILAKTINSLDAAQIEQYKNNANNAAKKLSSASNLEELDQIVFQLTDNRE